MTDDYTITKTEQYSVVRDEWVPKFTGTFRGPNGNVRDCGHRHARQDSAERCVKALRDRVFRESK